MATPASTPNFRVGFDPTQSEPWDLREIPDIIPIGALIQIAFPALTLDLVRGTLGGHTIAIRGPVAEPGMTLGPFNAPMPKAELDRALLGIEGHCRRLVRQLEATMAQQPPLVELDAPHPRRRR